MNPRDITGPQKKKKKRKEKKEKEKKKKEEEEKKKEEEEDEEGEKKEEEEEEEEKKKRRRRRSVSIHPVRDFLPPRCPSGKPFSSRETDPWVEPGFPRGPFSPLCHR